MRITMAEIRKRQAQPSPSIIWDGELAGLGIRVTAKAGSWLINYRHQGRERRMTFATLAQADPAKARKIAADLLLQVKAGNDPLAAKRQEEGQALAAIVSAWRKAKNNQWRPRTAKGYEDALRPVLAALGDRPMASITKADISAAILSIASPASRAHAGRAISAGLRWAEDAGLIDVAPLPRLGRLAPPVPPRDRILIDEEIAAIWRAADGLPEYRRSYIRFIILTATRREAARLAMAPMAKDGVTLSADTMKGGKAFTAFLSPWGMAQITPSARGFMFSGDGGKTAVDGTTLLRTLRKLTPDLAPWGYHDFRRSMRTWAAKSGFPAEVAEEALAHRSHRTALSRAYDLHDYAAQVQALHHAWQAHVRSLVT